MDLRFEAATKADEAEIRSLLAAAGLPHDDIAPHLDTFIVARVSGSIAGVVGIEAYGDAALLRSLAVTGKMRNHGIAHALHERILDKARAEGVATLYLLTQTARSFFLSLGYVEVGRREAPASIQRTHEFSVACPQSAVCMKKEI